MVKKEKRQLMDPLETLMIKGQQNFELHDQINPIQATIDDDRIVNTLKKDTGIYHKFTPIGILFPASVNNNTEQIFVTCRELNNAKPAHSNGNLVNLLGVINLNKINNWKYIKDKSLWINVNFDRQENVENTDYFCFSFKTASLNAAFAVI